MGTALNGFDIQSEQRVLTDDPVEAAAFWKVIHTTSAWQRYVRDFGNTPEHNEKVIAILNKLQRYDDGEFVTTSQFLDALNVAMNAGELQRKPVELEPESQPVPTDRNGRPLSASQIAWGEMVRWSESATSQAIAERRRTDASYAQFYLTNLRREFQGVQDGVVDLNARSESTGHVSPELALWVKEYRKMSSEERGFARTTTRPVTNSSTRC